MMPSMLIVDGDLYLRKLVLTYAQMEGFQCRGAETGAQALDILRAATADIVILDVIMQGMDGFEILAELRKFSQGPVILLTACGEEYDKLLGFNLGADDYVPKPFSPKELMARVGAVLRRAGSPAKGSPPAFGGLWIEPETRAVWVDGTPVGLPPRWRSRPAWPGRRPASGWL